MNLIRSEAKMARGLDEARAIFAQEVVAHPPTVGLVGASGTGKSTSINRMFKTHLAVSHTVACTKRFETSELAVSVSKPEFQGIPVRLRVIDAPGLGEDVNVDPQYIEMYQQHLGLCDVVLWVMTARNRAVALDQQYLRQLVEFHDRIVFGINQVDLVHPMDWDEEINLPSEEMERNIDAIAADRARKLSLIVGRTVRVIPYAAERGYRLEELFAALIASCPRTRQWIFALLKNFRLEDFYPVEAI